MHGGLDGGEGGLVVRTTPQGIALKIAAGDGLELQIVVKRSILRSKRRMDVVAHVLCCSRFAVSQGGAILSAMEGVVLYIPKGLAVTEAGNASTVSSMNDIGRRRV